MWWKVKLRASSTRSVVVVIDVRCTRCIRNHCKSCNNTVSSMCRRTMQGGCESGCDVWGVAQKWRREIVGYVVCRASCDISSASVIFWVPGELIPCVVPRREVRIWICVEVTGRVLRNLGGHWVERCSLIDVIGGGMWWRVTPYSILDIRTLIYPNVIDVHLGRELKMLEVLVLEGC